MITSEFQSKFHGPSLLHGAGWVVFGIWAVWCLLLPEPAFSQTPKIQALGQKCLGTDAPAALSAIGDLKKIDSLEARRAVVRAGIHWSSRGLVVSPEHRNSVLEEVFSALQGFGADAGPLFLLESKTADDPEFLIRSLVRLGPNVVPVLKQTLEQESSLRPRLTAALALEELGTKTIPVLLPELHSSAPALEAIQFLQHVELPSNIRLLIELMKSQDVTVWLNSRQAILQNVSEDTYLEVVIGLGDPSSQVRANLAYVLGILPPFGIKSLDGLGNLLGDESEEVRLMSAQALIAIGTGQAYEKLEWGLFHQDEDVRLSVNEALLSSLTDPGLALLGKLLESKEISLKVQAIDSFSRILKLELAPEEKTPEAGSGQVQKEDEERLAKAKETAGEALKEAGRNPDKRVQFAIRAFTQDPPDTATLNLAVGVIQNRDEALYPAALEVFRKRPDPKQIKPLISLLGDPKKEVTSAVSDVLVQFQNNQVIPPILQSFPEADPPAKINMLQVLEHFKDPSTVEFLIRTLHEPDGEVVHGATDALLVIGPQAAPQLITALKTDDLRAKTALIYLLGETQVPEAVKPLAGLFKTETNEGVINELGSAMIRIGEPALDSLALLLMDDRPVVRIIAASSLGEIPAVRSVYELMNALGDSNSEVVDTVGLSLVQLQDLSLPVLIDSLNLRNTVFQQRVTLILVAIGKPAVPGLIKAAADESPTRRAWAVVALGEIGNPAAVDCLIPRLRDPEEEIQKRAAIALIQIGEPAVKPLMAINESEDGHDRLWSTVALGEIKNPEAVPVLLKRLNDPMESISVEASKALVNIGAPAVLPLLKILEAKPDEKTSEQIRTIFSQMKDPEALALIKERMDPMYKATAHDELQDLLHSISK